MMSTAQSRAVLRYAFSEGYIVTVAGKILNTNTGIYRSIYYRKPSKGQTTHAYFSISFHGKKMAVACHRLAAYQKFGTAVFWWDIVVRHKDSDAKNFKLDNIILGTQADNMRDKIVAANRHNDEHFYDDVAASWMRVI